MSLKLSPQSKVGLFAAAAIVLIVYLTLRVSDLKFSPAGTYSVYVEMKSATDVDEKTPVMVAGIQVGIVEKIELTPDNRARLKLKLRRGVNLSQDVSAELRTRGVLGDTYLELIPGKSTLSLEAGDMITQVNASADFNELTRNLNDVALNLKDISVSIKKYVTTDDSPMAKIMKNMEKLTGEIAGFAGNNRQNMDQIVSNLRDLTRDLKGMVHENSDEVGQALERINSIVAKIDQGKGTVGKLINDPTTGEKINETLDNVNDLVGPVSRLQTELGYHMEYLGSLGDFKHYVHLNLKPRPDKFFLLEFISDPDPSPNRSTTVTNVTAGGVTTSVTTEQEVVNHSKFRFSAELAKKFYDFTLRAGLIESTGGAGADYTKGPFAIKFDAFDFNNSGGVHPHLKVMGTANVTKSFYVLAGADDFINKDRRSWFVGAGFRFLDDDIKSLLGAFAFGR